ncbi:AraC family transcriptional regulator [Allokutzneria oryzae]|uniref:Helix-turn-helix domain-containing protein n=1 Tax=Allokutzneria oryzae TaxID=1378989 RepID=A0ABV5ZPB1_9PSEU
MATAELTHHHPGPPLSAHVRDFCGYRERTAGPLSRRELPHLGITVVISFGEPLEVERALVESFVAGLHDVPVLTTHFGVQHGIEARLTPLGGYRLLGLPMSELAGAVAHLGDVLGRAGDELADRLAHLPDWPSRFALLERFLLRRLAEGPAPPRELDWAWRRIAGSAGRVPVLSLAEELGWSRGRLVTRFREHVGLPPKVVARVARFQHAIALLGRVSPAELALRCGYCDQSHFNREFRALAGCTPTEFRALEPVLVPRGEP